MKQLIPILLIVCMLYGCSSADITSTTPPTAPSVQYIHTTEITTIETITTPTVPQVIMDTTSVPTSASVSDPLELLVEQMDPEELVGQLFLARCPDMDALDDIRNYHLGGYILFDRDFEDQTPESVRETISGFQNVSDIPLLIAVDEEGGIVTRISHRPAFREEEFPSPADAYAQGGLELLLSLETEKCKLLRHLGINVNMAPVCDITTDPEAFMYQRSLGLKPEQTADVIHQMVSVMNEARIGSVLKHFPGYGNNTDTHTAMAEDHRSLEELESQDLLPFQAGIDAGCGAVLISHTVVHALDDRMPASLSPAVVSYLREQMHYEGVILTDDLIMEAITDTYGTEEAAVMAVLAGCDLLCSSEYHAQYQAVLDASREGRIPLDQIRQSVLRILKWKEKLGLLA